MPIIRESTLPTFGGHFVTHTTTPATADPAGRHAAAIPASRTHPGQVPTGTLGVDIDGAHRLMVSLVDRVCSVVRGRDHVVRLVACALVCGGHVLLEDVPGSGKTTLGRAFAAAANVEFGRVQATADMLPADITGSGVWQPAAGRFEFMPGPIFANLVLVDELNRASSRTQSAFMEALEEHAVTIDGERHPLPEPFFVIATQNPVEQHGTFPLPEGQLDRFTMCLHLGSISPDDELVVLREQVRQPTVEQLRPALDAASLTWLRAQSREVFTSEAVQRYLLSLVIGTRNDPAVAVGASTRSAIALNRAAQAWAILAGRDFVTPDDVKHLAVPVLAHRLSLAAGPSPKAAAAIVSNVVATVPVPLP